MSSSSFENISGHWVDALKPGDIISHVGEKTRCVVIQKVDRSIDFCDYDDVLESSIDNIRINYRLEKTAPPQPSHIDKTDLLQSDLNGNMICGGVEFDKFYYGQNDIYKVSQVIVNKNSAMVRCVKFGTEKPVEINLDAFKRYFKPIKISTTDYSTTATP